MPRFLAAFTTLIAALTASAPQALAQACTGRPGASAIEQYCEAIPEGTGERVGPSGSGGNAERGSGVSQSTSQQLQAAGRDGVAVLGIVAASGSNNGGSSQKPSSGSGGGPTGDARAPSSAVDVLPAKSPSDNPLKAVSSSVSNGSTVGPAFLWGLLALAAASGAVAWIGFRRSHHVVTPPTTDE